MNAGARVWLAVGAAALAACSPWPAPGGDPGESASARWIAPAREVEYGERFSLELVRTWPAGAEALDFALDSVADLPLELAAVRERRRGGRSEQWLRFDARAYRLESFEVSTRALEWRESADETWRLVEAPLALALRSALAEAPGAPEWPTPADLPFAKDRRGLGLALAAAGLAVFGVWCFARAARRRERLPAPPAPPTVSAEAALASELAHLGRLEMEREAFEERLDRLLGNYLGQRAGLVGTSHTLDELLPGAGLGPELNRVVQTAGRRVEAARFGARWTDAEERQARIGRLRAALLDEETRMGAGETKG